MLIFASDLDNTLIYSHKYIKENRICIETKEGKELSYMTTKSYEKLQNLKGKIEFIPVTTRSLEQYKRIRLFKEDMPYALVSNGGILLEKGKINTKWLEETKSIIEPCKNQMEIAYKYLVKDEKRIFDIRNIDDLFLFTKSKDTSKTSEELKKYLDLSMVLVVENHNKIYVIPKLLDKGLAIKRLRNIFPEHKILSAGDSSFDLPMLKEADLAITLHERSFINTLTEKENTYFWKGKEVDFSEYVLDIVKKSVLGNL